MAIISRMMRSALSEALSQDYVRTARAMGLSPRRVLVYALKNALIPVVSVSVMAIGFMFGSAIMIEQVFGIGGFHIRYLAQYSKGITTQCKQLS